VTPVRPRPAGPDDAPGGAPSQLNGSPVKLRVAWPDASPQGRA
jgi:hypothetical protein